MRSVVCESLDSFKKGPEVGSGQIGVGREPCQCCIHVLVVAGDLPVDWSPWIERKVRTQTLSVSNSLYQAATGS